MAALRPDEAALVQRIEDALASSGERDALRASVAARLDACGWTARVRDEAERMLHAAAGEGAGAPLSPQDMCAAIVPRALSAIPADVRAAAREEVRRFLEERVRLAP